MANIKYLLKNLSSSIVLLSYQNSNDNMWNYQIVLNTDDANFGGFNRVDNSLQYPAFEKDNKWYVSVYLTNRTAIVFKNLAV